MAKGRPKGSLNATSIMAKEAFQLAFNKIGGYEALAKWASKNPSEFYKIYGRLIPIDATIGGQKDNPIEIIKRIIVYPAGKEQP